MELDILQCFQNKMPSIVGFPNTCCSGKPESKRFLSRNLSQQDFKANILMTIKDQSKGQSKEISVLALKKEKCRHKTDFTNRTQNIFIFKNTIDDILERELLTTLFEVRCINSSIGLVCL